jgi:hypothetical protein
MNIRKLEEGLDFKIRKYLTCGLLLVCEDEAKKATNISGWLIHEAYTILDECIEKNIMR